MNYYLVSSPEYATIDPVLDFGQGPKEYGCDVVYVKARNVRDAKAIGLACLRTYKTFHEWHDGCENPYKGMFVQVIDKNVYYDKED